MLRDMRSPVLPLLLGFSMIGCIGVIGEEGPSGGGDDVGPSPTCGNGVVDPGESCDDGNNISGDGCSATCSMEEIITPRVSMVIDNPSVTTELGTTTLLTVALASSGGFSGPVNLTAVVPETGWTVAIQPATVTLGENAVQEAVVTLTIPSENKGLSGTIQVSATATGVTIPPVTSSVTAENQLTIPLTLNNGQCVYPAAGTTNVTVGTKIRWLNKATSNVAIHINGGLNGLSHGPNNGHAPETAYEQTVNGTGQTTWYCHAPGPTVNNLVIRGVAAE